MHEQHPQDDDEYELNDEKSDGFILSIDSPKTKVHGPYVVVFAHAQERWAIVALHWGNEPRLGIRWFWGSMGNPTSTAHRTWFIIPSALNHAILSGLPLPFRLRHLLEEFFYEGKNQEALELWQAAKWLKK